MGFITDKITDAIFIFVGVYFAFHFDQYQEDLSLKRELKFNLAEIMKTLPEEKPLKYIEPFKIEKKKEEKGCSYHIDVNFDTLTTGGDFLKVIKQRGLVKFLKNKDLISIMTVYYNDIVPDYNERRKLFYSSYQDKIVGFLEESGDMPCVSMKQMGQWEKSISKLYMDAKIQDGAAQQIGQYIRSELEKSGYKANEKKNYRLNYYFEMADSPEKMKLIEERRKQKKIETIGDALQPSAAEIQK